MKVALLVPEQDGRLCGWRETAPCAAFRAYMTEPERLPELIEIDGLPEDLRETLAERLLHRR